MSGPVTQAAQGPATSVISASELARLSEISTRLASLNERLRTELETSRTNSFALADSLETSTRELATLRLELEASRRSSSELVARVERSATESTELLAALTRADGSLRSLEESFAAYRKEAEERIRSLGRGRLYLTLAAVAGWIVAILALLT